MIQSVHAKTGDSRDLGRLSNEQFDVLVIGGGAAGAATAREAALRGFKTALVEREDFAAGASAHCFKVVHGGIRYLQHADLTRLRASCRERSILLRIAPNLVAPLPFAVPTYGGGKSSRWFLGAGMLVYDALTRDLNQQITDPRRRIHGTRFLSRADILKLFPAVADPQLTGAAIFEDGQMHNPPRLVLAFIRAATALGATVANYVEAEKMLTRGSEVIGASVVDRIGGAHFDIRARLVINAAGPWAESLWQGAPRQPAPPGTYSRDSCFIVSRRCETNIALAIQGRTRDSDALLARSARHLFLVPWRNYTLVGVWHSIVPREPDRVLLPREELAEFLGEVNACYPTLALDESEVCKVDFGLVPFGDKARQNGGLSFGKQSRLVDHRAHGTGGLLTLISVRFTVARRDAVEALNLAESQLGTRQGGLESEHRALQGGDIADIGELEARHVATRPEWLPAAFIPGLVRNYGSDAGQVISLAEREPDLRRHFSDSHVSYAEAVYSIRNEMTQRMSDVVFRRTELGTAAHPGPVALNELRLLLKREMGWSEQRAADELAGVESEFGRYLANPTRRRTAAPQEKICGT